MGLSKTGLPSKSAQTTTVTEQYRPDTLRTRVIFSDSAPIF